MNKNIFVFAILMWISISAFGTEMIEPNRVSFQLQAEQWVLTNTAEFTVSVDATLDKLGLAQARAQILGKLAALSKDADWHITVFDRSQNQSGLEQLRVEAQTRLPEKDLSNLRDKAKEISKPGLIFNIQQINFIPSLADYEKVRTELRSTIYTNAQAEVERLNKAFPNQNYSVHAVIFHEGLVTRQLDSRESSQVFYKIGMGQAAPAPLAISTKMQTAATVELDSSSTNGR